jgi:acrylyl-CoA reductase (NADPH)
MESETWAGCVDAVGGAMLARVLGQLKHGASVAAVGNAGGIEVPIKIIPFLLRGVNLLGIDSVTQPFEARQRAWARIARELPLEKLEEMAVPTRLEDLPRLGAEILEGKVRGRVVVDVGG